MANFKATTWNVENLFRPNAGASAADHARYQQKLALLAATISSLEPDVVALQEVGGLEPLQDLQQNLPKYPHAHVSSFPDDRGIRVAFLSMHAIGAPEDIVDFPPGPALQINGLNSAGSVVPITRMGRGALRIQVNVAGVTVDLLTVHLKSKLLTFPRPAGGSPFVPRDENERAQVGGIALMRRSAEAVTVRMRANALLTGNASTRLIVLGDFNDVPEAQTSLLLNGPPGSELGTSGFSRRDQGDDRRLFNVAAAIPESRRFSRVHRGRKELLDQIFASEELFPVNEQDKRQGPIQADSFVDFTGQVVASVTDDPNERTSAIAPDHAPVSATFSI
jgi:endonuclease/exonuclease/phosphatase family metal-dependent hydrolase